MRVPLEWLHDYVRPELDVRELATRLALTGTEVDRLHHHGVAALDAFVVGRVLEAGPHPDADRLTVCRVAVADGEETEIVCGAPNVAAGQTVAVARPGAIMPDGTALKQARLRGVVSDGMILAESELDIGVGKEGILVLDGQLLDAELAPGTPLAEVLPISTDVLELEITSNRPDCLGIYGVARELHAATEAELAPGPWTEDPVHAGEVVGAAIEVRCPDLCRRFTARVYENVRVAPSPPWLKARLMAAGQRPINNVVDITNYAMLLTGQPLHAFDLDRVAGARLVVRRADAGERVRTLDGQERVLDEQMVVIEDDDGPTSIAGLMGGARSEVHETTTRVLMEVANWSGANIHRSSLRLGLRSEASARFEKDLAPEQCLDAQAVAAQLMIACAGADAPRGTIDIGYEARAPTALRLRERRVHAILGVAVPVERQTRILRALDFGCEPAADGLDVTVPAVRRNDVYREIDLIEEVARIDGLERLPATLPARRGAAGLLTHAQRVRRLAEDAMVGRGLHEVVGWSFAEPALLDRLLLPADHEMRRVVRLANPMAETQSIMRPTLLGSLLDAARHNVARNGPDVAIFESGAVYRDRSEIGRRGAELADEHNALGVLLTGALEPRTWRGQPPRADFFAAKALLEVLLGRLRVAWSVHARAWPFLHPGRSAAVHAGERALGFIGELHPLVARAWDLPHAGTGEHAAVFVVDVDALAVLAPPVTTFEPFAVVPPLRQDIAVTLGEGVGAEQLLAAVREAAGDVLEDARIFDVYTGEQVGEGRRSLAIALSFRARDRTLTDDEVAPARERIVAAVAGLGGELRG
jgi:phenylalanyl-tRNA synthetase beta chain